MYIINEIGQYDQKARFEGIFAKINVVHSTDGMAEISNMFKETGVEY